MNIYIYIHYLTDNKLNGAQTDLARKRPATAKSFCPPVSLDGSKPREEILFPFCEYKKKILGNSPSKSK